MLGFLGLRQLALFLLFGLCIFRVVLLLLFGLFLFAFFIAHGSPPVVFWMVVA